MGDLWGTLKEIYEAKKELKRKISEINNEITMLENIKLSIERIRLQIEGSIEDWETEHTQYDSLDLTEEIQILNSFEGKAAEDLALNFPPIVEEITAADGKAAEVASAIGDQLTKIDDYIEILKAKRDELCAQLEAL